MEKKVKVWMIAFLSGVILLIGWFLPYSNGTVIYTWLWGLITTGGIPSFAISPNSFLIAIILLIFTLATLLTGFMAKKREELKKMGTVWVLLGVIFIIVLFIPMVGGMTALSFGFYISLIGGIIEILAGVAALLGK